MLRPATQVSTLLARSFFMGFSLTVFSLLARLRVLVQQILLDIVLVFNTVSYLSQTKHSVKLNHQGLEVFREFYPKEEDYVTLECAWNTDKFILVERTNTCEIEMQEGDSDGEVSGGNEMRYKTIESVLGDNEPTAENADAERSPHMNEATTDVIMDGNDEDKKQVEHFGEEVDNIVVTDNPRKKNASRASSLADTGTSAGTGSLILTTNARKVAFVSVKRPSSSTANPTDIPSKETGSNGGDKTDAFYSLLTCGNLNDSLFG